MAPPQTDKFFIDQVTEEAWQIIKRATISAADWAVYRAVKASNVSLFKP
jgi:hypothetical protein